jgi:superfamily II DNA or RNA helicase
VSKSNLAEYIELVEESHNMYEPSLEELLLLDRYSTNRNDLIADFYTPCLNSSTRYDRAVGFFRSSILQLATYPVSEFASNGGHIRLICSPQLSPDDIAGITNGYLLRETVGEVLRRDIEQALQNSISKPIVEFFATLIAVNCMDIKIAFRPTASGIFHDKIGIFHDFYGNSISFTGSSNETLSAWDSSGNHESFDVFRSWTSDAKRVQQHMEYFEKLWLGREPGLDTISFPEVALGRLMAVSNINGLEEAYRKVIGSNSITKRYLLPHQSKAIDEWAKHGFCGILQHATGSGKTFTAISAIRGFLAKGRPIIILVPSELLLEQWYGELLVEFSDIRPRILLVGGGHTSWKKEDIIEGYTLPSGGPRVIISTLHSASNEEFISRIQGGDHLVMVIDEVHRAGSKNFSNIFGINSGSRLGLSATPYRYGDREGTKKIFDYFHGIIEPPFTLSDAIAAGRLCRYTYHIHEVHLQDDEIEEWQQISQKIRSYIKKAQRDENGKIIPNNYLKLLFIKRARIIKRASEKVELAVNVIKGNYQAGQRWLIYCDSKSQLLEVSQALENTDIKHDEYRSEMGGNKATTLDYFITIGGILLAIKCLDEGIDIPTIDHALILASSKNPREFIQRRGRVLRKTPDKSFAEIHDAIVLPPIEGESLEDFSFVRGELLRAQQFSLSSENQAVRYKLRKLARVYDLDIDNIDNDFDFELDEGD